MKTQHGEIVMNDLDFLDQAESLLKAVEHSCDRINDASLADIDNQRVGGMVTLIFANQSQIIINLQKPLHEVWLAAKAGGFHFKFESGQWIDTKGQGEFFNCLSRFSSEQAGSSLVFSSQSVSK
jgi:CyaY protein